MDGSLAIVLGAILYCFYLVCLYAIYLPDDKFSSRLSLGHQYIKTQGYRLMGMIWISWGLCALAINSALLELLPIGWAEGNYLEVLRIIAIAVALWFVQSRVKLPAWVWLAAPQIILVGMYLHDSQIQKLSTHILLLIGFLPLAVRQYAINRYGHVSIL